MLELYKDQEALDTHFKNMGSTPGMLTQGGQGRGRPDPLASRLYRTPPHFLLTWHGIEWKLHTFAPPRTDRELSPQVGARRHPARQD